MQDLNSLTARSLNCTRGRWDTFWTCGTYSRQKLATPKAVLNKMVYTQTNPARAFLVPESHQWPGLISKLGNLDFTYKANRPWKFFNKKGKMPESVSFKLSKPPCFEEMSDCEYQDMVMKEVYQVEATIQDEAKRTGKQFLGRKAILKQHYNDRPKSKAPRRNLNPCVAACDRNVMREELRKLKTFRIEHREKRNSFLNGDRDVVFPAGTYWMRVHCGVVCEPYEEEVPYGAAAYQSYAPD